MGKSWFAAFRLTIPFLKDIKGFIWADGKFELKRAIIVFAGFLSIVGAIAWIGPEGAKLAIQLLGEFSDSIGYVPTP